MDIEKICRLIIELALVTINLTQYTITAEPAYETPASMVSER